MAAEAARKFVRSYEDLDVYQRSMALLKPVHEMVLSFPDYEKFDLANQMRRACKSVPSNIAEGYAKRRSAREFRAFLTNAMGSANEMEVHLKIVKELGYITAAACDDLVDSYRIVGKQLFRLIEHWRTLDSQPPASSLQGPNS